MDEWSYDSEDGSRTPLNFRVTRPSPKNLSFVIREKTFFDSVSKDLGLCTGNILTGDAHLDQTYIILTDEPDRCREFFARPEVIPALLALFSFEFKRVGQEGGTLYAKKRVVGGLTRELSEQIKEHAGNSLSELARAQSESAIPPDKGEAGSRRVFRQIMTIGYFILGFVATGFWSIARQKFPPVSNTEIYCCAALFGMVAASGIASFLWPSIRIGTRRHYDLGVALILGSAVLFAAFGGLITNLNGRLDTGEEVIYDTVVVDKEFSTNRNMRVRAYVIVDSWIDPSETVKVRVPVADYEKVKKGRAVRIATRPGAFNIEWVSGYELD